MFRAPRAHGTPRSTRRPLFSISRIIKTTALLTAAIVAGVLASGGTFAYLNSSVALPTATIHAGTATLATSGSPLSLTGFYPGDLESAAFTVTNTGTVPLALTVASLTPPTANVVSQNLALRVDITATASACTSGSGLPATPTWQGTFASWAAGSLASTLAVGASATVCLSATLSNATPASAQGLSSNSFGVTIGGVQS
jgi:predicted ribosomally synthesized peptide with SipW-like signal peptide